MSWQILDDEQRVKHSQREELAASERRNAVLGGEIDELRSQIDVLEKTRKMAETEVHEISERVADLTNVNSALLATKKKLELELQSVHVRTTSGQTLGPDSLFVVFHVYFFVYFFIFW